MSFTQYLLDKYSAEFKKATEHPFLVSAGNGTIKEDTLVKWLRQDYLYAYVGYLKFASLLLSRIPINTLSPETQTTQRQKGLDKSIPLLTFSLSNIHREKNFFISTAERHELNLFVDGSLPQILDLNGDSGLLGEYEEITRSYVDFLWAVAVGGSVEDGLVLLWAMEKAYYTAWSYAKTHLPSAEPQTLKEKALREFIDNWTCEEFVGFVNDCTEVVDLLEIDPESEVGKRAEELIQGLQTDTLARTEVLAGRELVFSQMDAWHAG